MEGSEGHKRNTERVLQVWENPDSSREKGNSIIVGYRKNELVIWMVFKGLSGTSGKISQDGYSRKCLLLRAEHWVLSIV